MKGRHAVLLSGALVLGLVSFPAAAAAQTNEPIAQTGGMETTLPLLGTSLTVGVSLGPTGDISGVTLTPTGTLSQTSSSATLVKFSNADGSATLKVRAAGSSLSVGAKAKTLASLVGNGTWKADVFGDGSPSTVAYTIGDDGSGKPTLAIGAINAGAGITATVDAPQTKTAKKWSTAWGGVTFARNGFVKHLAIAVTVKLADSSASLAITLSGKDRQRLEGTLAELAGSRTWSAHLCDGTAVAVAYHVTADGAVVFDSATGHPFTVKDWPGGKGWHHGWFDVGGDKVSKVRGSVVDGLVVRFDKTRVGLAVLLVKRDGGAYALLAQGSSGSCHDRVEPKGTQKADRSATTDAFRDRDGDGDRARGQGFGGSGRHHGS